MKILSLKDVWIYSTNPFSFPRKSFKILFQIYLPSFLHTRSACMCPEVKSTWISMRFKFWHCLFHQCISKRGLHKIGCFFICSCVDIPDLALGLLAKCSPGFFTELCRQCWTHNSCVEISLKLSEVCRQISLGCFCNVIVTRLTGI